jgi:NAD(P)-dependent dehydrogenase (short-subunit alcohol dehydrogenase family)
MTRIVAVTGASRGIGRATALAMARNGYQVFALARSESELRQLSREAAQTGLDIVPAVMDIARDVDRESAVSEIIKATDDYGLDVLVNNAGYGQMGPMEEVSPDQLRRQLEVNVVGALAFTQPFLPGMRRRGNGVIVNVSSVSARVVAPFSGAYAASKSALEAMSDALRLELWPFGVHVVLIEPGPIRTGFTATARSMTPDPSASPYSQLIQRFENGRKGWYVFERPPESVATVILKAVQADRPRARYTVTFAAGMTNIVRRLVPDAASDWAMRRTMGARRQ